MENGCHVATGKDTKLTSARPFPPIRLESAYPVSPVALAVNIHALLAQLEKLYKTWRHV